MAATPAVMQQIQKTGTTYIPGGLPPNNSVAPPQLVKPANPVAVGTEIPVLPPVMPTPAPAAPQIGGEQSLTPGQIIFTEYQARVFNQTEAMYKTSGFLGISLFVLRFGKISSPVTPSPLDKPLTSEPFS